MIGVIYEVLSANVKRPAGLHSANVKRPAGLLLSDPRVAAEQLLHLHNQCILVLNGKCVSFFIRTVFLTRASKCFVNNAAG